MPDGRMLIAVREHSGAQGAAPEQLRAVSAALETKGFEVRWAVTAEDAQAVLRTEAGLAAALVAWDLPGDTATGSSDGNEGGGAAVLRHIGRRFQDLPVFLVMGGEGIRDLPLWVSEMVVGYVWPLEDTAGFIAGRIATAARAYREAVLPPFFRALRRFDDAHEYSWHTPAHAGGVAFLKSPAGRAFHDYFGERLLRSDLSISVEELGSLFEHTGPIGAAERNAARVFDADLTYFVLHGDSTCNRLVGHFSVTRDELALVDRNCHKSVLHGLVVSGARPVYLVPTRNGYGLAGPLPPTELAPEAVAARIAAHPLAEGALSAGPQYAVFTNSTYDGLCYDAVPTARALAASAPRVHFDEAWFAYARFHPLYAGRYGMAVDESSYPGPDRPTVFATQSTHKLLAALSQSAMVHVRPAPRAPVEHERFNEVLMMHGTTSPLYPMIASLDVATAMMDGPQGEWLVDEAVTEAVRFRQEMVRLRRRIEAAGDRPPWFFGVWQPPTVTDPATGAELPFDEAPSELLRTEPSCWTLDPGADWHGFPGLTEGHCMLDPVKVTLSCPGITASGEMEEEGIPARVLTAYLATRNIVVEKTDSYTTLVLFSMGITKGKWGTLLDALMDFKALYDGDAPLERVLPQAIAAHPNRYGGLRLRELCRQMHDQLRSARLVELLDTAFQELPEPVFPPQHCYQRLVRGGTERVRIAQAAGRIAAAMVTVTPPGIPVLMPGESVGAPDGPLLRYLTALESFDRRFPGFRSETHGVTIDADTGDYQIECLLPDGDEQHVAPPAQRHVPQPARQP
ncbi:ornithine decarboxylase /response regulator receiver protein [Streptomyces sp. 1222.5]|uniref:Orn/Lys/Arg family decarboxylase n=1 Tax=unclassified Streptomyces TaxID=2593676 RepID=UPI00089A45DA|nr:MULTISPECIES: Orn/Lys/Arg decarboxylase N-terminal domain-containing protein [unclassified Streptomyces]PKW12414.1 ornithine decarboxylase /response regulator receiver protein [Streptomyces sp. 5112.2]SEB56801.1 ornithine decarboxylase /response regulator receiver protein [Streptomyces sp. 1222.5]